MPLDRTWYLIEYGKKLSLDVGKRVWNGVVNLLNDEHLIFRRVIRFVVRYVQCTLGVGHVTRWEDCCDGNFFDKEGRFVCWVEVVLLLVMPCTDCLVSGDRIVKCKTRLSSDVYWDGWYISWGVNHIISGIGKIPRTSNYHQILAAIFYWWGR